MKQKEKEQKMDEERKHSDQREQQRLYQETLNFQSQIGKRNK